MPVTHAPRRQRRAAAVRGCFELFTGPSLRVAGSRVIARQTACFDDARIT
jgi:hypothetical protein